MLTTASGRKLTVPYAPFCGGWPWLAAAHHVHSALIPFLIAFSSRTVVSVSAVGI